MTVLSLAVGTSSDDASQSGGASLTTLTAASASLGTGNFPLDTPHRAMGFRWTAVTVPQGSTITTAVFQICSESSFNTTTFHWHGQAVDTAATFVTNENMLARAQTTATIFCNAQNSSHTAGTFYTWPTGADFAAIVTEITGRAGWASGNALAMIADGDGSAAFTSSTQRMWDGVANPGATMVITYTAGPTDTPVSSTDSAAVSDAPPFNVSLGGQYAFDQPAADLSAGLWTPSAGGTLFGMLNETIADASTFDVSSLGPTSDTFEVSLGTAPVAIDLNAMPGVLNYQYQGSVIGGRRIDLTVVLLCNSVPVQTWTLVAIQSTFLIAPLQLSSAGLAAIIPGGALSLRTTATQV